MAAAYNITFRQATLLNVNSDDTIEILPAGGESKGELIKFDYLIICTGFSYAKPIKDASANTLIARKKSLLDQYQKIEESDSILVVGGGIVGVELAGELAVKYGKTNLKKIGICQRGDRLLPLLPSKAGMYAELFFKEHNV